MTIDDIPIAGYFPGRHKVSCAVLDPTPGPCDCGAVDIPLVKLSDARLIFSSQQFIIHRLSARVQVLTDTLEKLMESDTGNPSESG